MRNVSDHYCKYAAESLQKERRHNERVSSPVLLETQLAKSSTTHFVCRQPSELDFVLPSLRSHSTTQYGHRIVPAITVCALLIKLTRFEYIVHICYRQITHLFAYRPIYITMGGLRLRTKRSRRPLYMSYRPLVLGTAFSRWMFYLKS
jgi:hypothetical protein